MLDAVLGAPLLLLLLLSTFALQLPLLFGTQLVIWATATNAQIALSRPLAGKQVQATDGRKKAAYDNTPVRAQAPSSYLCISGRRWPVECAETKPKPEFRIALSNFQSPVASCQQEQVDGDQNVDAFCVWDLLLLQIRRAKPRGVSDHIQMVGNNFGQFWKNDFLVCNFLLV